MVNEPQENYKTGFISIYRSVKKHWIWQDEKKLKWWLDILFTVNHSDNKVNIGYELFDCKRGQSVQSLKSWAENWKVSKDTVRNFFKLLQKDKMISLENLTKTTRLTVCNYDSYQGGLHDKQTTSKRKPYDKQTLTHPNNNVNNENNVKKVIKNKKIEPPTFEEFKTYALEKEPLIEIKSLELKYESWKVNGWKNGNDKKIVNWKSSLLNTLQYLPKRKALINDNNYEVPAKINPDEPVEYI